MFRQYHFALTLSIFAIFSTTMVEKVRFPHLTGQPFSNDTIQYRDDSIRQIVAKYVSKTIKRKGKEVFNSYYRKDFADIIDRLHASEDNFIFYLDRKRTIGEVEFDGTDVYVIVANPGEAFGSVDHIDGILFEEVKHAEQFLDGKTLFQKKGPVWKPASNLQIEVEAKMFVTTQLKYNTTYKVEYNGVVYDTIPTVLAYLKRLPSDAERCKYLKLGVKLPYRRGLGKIDTLTFEGAYPEHDTTWINNPLTVRTKNDTIFGYPKSDRITD
jgi:hypothetical protein